MKKLIASISLAAVILSGTSALAAQYDLEDNSVSSIEGDKYQTVLIVKDGTNTTDDDIVYLGQSDSKFSATTEFLLKEKPEDGLYLLKLSGTGLSTDVTKFYIGMPITTEDIAAAKTFNEDGSVAFGWESISLDSCRTIIVKLDDSVYGYDLGTTMTGPGSASVGVRITGIPSEVESTSAYMSANSLSDITGSKGD